MNSDDSDDEVLANLLANADNKDLNPTNTDFSDHMPSVLKEFDYNFSDGISTNFDNETVKKKSPKSRTESDSFTDDHHANSSDDEILANLLANKDDKDLNLINEEPSKQVKSIALKELDYNFIDGISTNIVDKTIKIKSPKSKTESVSFIDDHANSSDDDDKKYFEKQQYSEYGRTIKYLLKNKESENISLKSNLKNDNNCSNASNNISTIIKSNNLTPKTDNSSFSNKTQPLHKSDKNNLQIQENSNFSTKKSVYSDPIFGLKIIKPLISSTELIEKMQGRKAVSVSSIKLHLMNQSAENLKEDWVIAGVILNKSMTKTSQKGNRYCIWRISDLSTDMKTVSIFLFNSAYNDFWKITNGTVVCILNPSVLESRDDKDLATLSVNNGQKIIVLGFSRDLGKCKSVKKNGEPCTAAVNLSSCEYCVYHIKQEYAKYSRRSELQTTSINRAFGISKNDLKKTGAVQQRHPDALPFIAIPAKRNEALYKKDCERLALLRGDKSTKEKNKMQSKLLLDTKVKTTSVELSSNQAKKDFERLNKLRKWNDDGNILSPLEKEEKKEFKLNLSSPKLGKGMKGGIIDFSEPVSKDLVNKAKLNAIEWIRNNGSIKKTNPNKIRPNKELLKEKGLKRKREENKEEKEHKTAEKSVEKDIIKNKFLEMMEMKSAHGDLIENRESEEMEQYFKKGESKEQMEMKMLETFQINCKAVYCRVCKYIAFSSSDLCKTQQHPIKVINAVKKFFKCANCENRTVSLDRIPIEPCKKCSSIKWLKTAMMDEKRTKISGPKLCIRGGEEKFIGSTVTDASLSLLIPESD